MQRENFTVLTESEVLRINKSADGQTATGVTFIDSDGNTGIQPADIVVVAAYQLDNVRLLLLSGIGQPYDHSTGEGVVGRAYNFQTLSYAYLYFENEHLKAVASGPMIEAIEHSTQHMTYADLSAIANYLKSLPETPVEKPVALTASDERFATGKRIYEANCIACHTSAGTGVRDMIPALASNPQLQASDTASMLNVLLKGSPGPVTKANPTGAAMPRFDWKLTDEQVADVLTYVRNDWGNAAPPVQEKAVSDMRKPTGAADYLGN